jgi:hypothetical protein
LLLLLLLLLLSLLFTEVIVHVGGIDP